MDERILTNVRNTNPLVFEELATSLATLHSYSKKGDMGIPVSEFQHLYVRALKHPLGYREINEIAGNTLGVRDRRSGWAAWLLMRTQNLRIVSVNSTVMHKVAGKISVPLLSHVGAALGASPSDLQWDFQMPQAASCALDVVGVANNEIWLVQTIAGKVLCSALNGAAIRSPGLFSPAVFKTPSVSKGDVEVLRTSKLLMSEGLRGMRVRIRTFILVVHEPDFELHEVDDSQLKENGLLLSAQRMIVNSHAFALQIQDDQDSIVALSQRFDDENFGGIPPCRAGRTLNILSSAARRQSASPQLLLWRQRDVVKLLKEDYDYDVTRDKLRHDLDDRLVGQGFMKKWSSEYYLSVRGMARYHYCLGKYTNQGTDAMAILELCTQHREKIVEHFGCLI